MNNSKSLMWQFLNGILELLKKVNWKAVWHEIIKVPKWIKNTLILVLLLSGCYFGYTKIYTNTDINQLQSQVIVLDHKVSSVISKSDYTVDIEYMITSLYILEELSDQIYDISIHNRDYIRYNMEQHMPTTEYILRDLQRDQDRIEQQHKALKAQLRQMIDKFQPDNQQQQNNKITN